MFILVEGFETDAALREIFEMVGDELFCSVEGKVICSASSLSLRHESRGEASFDKHPEDSSHD